MSGPMKRREFIKAGAVAGIGAVLTPRMLLGNVPAPQISGKRVRVALIGVGLRGTVHLKNLLERKDVAIPAICDINRERNNIARKLIRNAGHPEPAVFDDHDTVYRKLLDRDDVDAVIISTPWEWHAPMGIDAMRRGKAVGMEVAGAFSVQECWDMVHAREETGTPFMFLENVCYRRDIMAVLRMVRENLFGELLHCHCGYQHDLRDIKIQPGAEFGEKGRDESVWRTGHSVHRNGELYPTHGIGPVASFLNINRGNRLVSLSSVATRSRGLNEYIVKTGGKNHPNARVKFKLGDIVTTMLTTANGETIVMTHDTNLPRPYSLGFRVQGTRGLWMDDGSQIHIEGKSDPHRWEPAEKYLKKYDHPLWKKFADRAAGSGHGGMDFFVLNAFVEALKRREPMPLDIYDYAAWSVITPLSETSIAEGGEPQAIPDFTGGRWMRRQPILALDDRY